MIIEEELGRLHSRISNLEVALRRLIGKAKAVECQYDSEDQRRAADELDISIQIAEEALK